MQKIIQLNSYRKGLIMTVRELINILLNYEADEVIDFFLLKEDYTPRIIIKEVSKESDLPYIEFKES